MISPAASLSCTRAVTASPSALFQLFTTTAGVLAWLCHAAEVDPCLGGRIYLWWHQGYYSAEVFTEVRLNQQLTSEEA
jgi:uncharacterized protein YndB with AHSA1/START domain